MDYDLYIFDLDDTLVMTEYYHYKSWLYVLKEHHNSDFFIDYNTYIKYFHTTKENGIQEYLHSLKIYNCDKLSIIKTQYFLQNIKNKTFELELNKDCESFIKSIINNNKRFVIVSNSPKIVVEEIVSQFPILQYATNVYFRELFKFKKPNPECYIKVLEQFPNHRMIGFEDSLTGINALMQIPEITPVFINDSSYYHFDYIRKTYSKLKWITSFNDII